MRISIPTLSGITSPSPVTKEIIRSIEEIATNLLAFTSRGIVPKLNISHEVVTLVSEEQGWITRPHSLRREPLGYLLRGGNPSAILDIRLTADSVQVLMKQASSISIVVM
jgi:hypothetical protein